MVLIWSIPGYLHWHAKRPRLTLASPLHTEIVAVWYALLTVEIFGPVFIYVTLTSNVYLRALSDKFVPCLMRYGITLNSACSQYDGAKVDTKNCGLYRYFRENSLVVTNVIGLTQFFLFSVRILEGKWVSEKLAHSFIPVSFRNWNHFYKTSNSSSG